MLDDTPKDDVLTFPHDLQHLQQQIPHTPMNVRWSTRHIRPSEIFSPSLYSILLINANEPKCYDEVV